LGLPGGFVAVVLGVVVAWSLKALGLSCFEPLSQPYRLAFHPPVPVPQDLLALLFHPLGWKYLAVILPMGLFNVIGSLQNLESAEAAGDRYETRPSLLANGIVGLIAGLFGSPFPTTIYIGHPAWKAMGARTGYSAVNGAVICLLCLIGGVSLVLRVVPLEVTIGILLWIGIVITAQAFQEIPKSHSLAVAFGLLPALASWALMLIETTLRIAGSSLSAALPRFGNDIYIAGVISLSQGFLISSMVLAAMLVHVIERQFLKASLWMLAAAALSMIGVMHAYDLTATGVRNKFGLAAAPSFGAMYAVAALVLLALHLHQRRQKETA
jgi:adenine/guanine/hypoxanthine permease